MNYHFDSRVVLSRDSPYQNLYKVFLLELDQDGKQIGRDQIPWRWTLYFAVEEFILHDVAELRVDYRNDSKESTYRRLLNAKMRPSDRDDERTVRYSMFGTTRTISHFSLSIRQCEDDEKERCECWGGVSYTTEIDFYDVTEPDSICFTIYIAKEAFSQFVHAVSTGRITQARLMVNGVSGFYSDWSPSISTGEIKVLTAGKEHKVEVPPDWDTELPRLGEVGEAELSFTRTLDLTPPTIETEDDPKTAESPFFSEDPRPSPNEQRVSVVSVVDPQWLKLLSSIRNALWLVAGLLVLLLIAFWRTW